MICADRSAIVFGQAVEELQFAEGNDRNSSSLIFSGFVCKTDFCSVISLLDPIFVKEMNYWSWVSVLFRVLQQSPDTGATLMSQATGN